MFKGCHIRSMSQENLCRLFIVQEVDIPIGNVQFTGVKFGGIADWGFNVRPNSAKGTEQTFCTLALEFTFKFLKLHKVYGQAIASNQALIDFHERLGFKREADLRDQKRINNEFYRFTSFGLLASEQKVSI